MLVLETADYWIGTLSKPSTRFVTQRGRVSEPLDIFKKVEPVNRSKDSVGSQGKQQIAEDDKRA
jgi:hypothetical protein